MFNVFRPRYFLKSSKFALLSFMVVFIPSIIYGAYLALFASPIDYQQGDFIRIMYIHVPAAWMSLIIYVFIGCCSLGSTVWRIRMMYLLAVAAAPIGCCFAVITLITGAIWGKFTWGTWWVWDARLTSMLVLFLLYLSYIIIVNAGDSILRSEKPASIISIIGVINVPIVKFSVNIWSTLHQESSVIRIGGPTIHVSMLWPLFTMFIVFFMYFMILVICRVHILIVKLKLYNLMNLGVK